jgi:hypothetical protein
MADVRFEAGMSLRPAEIRAIVRDVYSPHSVTAWGEVRYVVAYDD